MRAVLAMIALAAPLALAVPAQAAPTQASNTFTVTNNGFVSYDIDGVDNPTLHLVRGETYDFDITANGHPFFIKTVQSTGTGNQYTTGVMGNGTQTGTLTFSVAANAPNQLFYICQFHGGMSGSIQISSPTAPAVTLIGAAALILMLAAAGTVIARRRAT